MNLFNILVGLYLFTFQTVLCDTIFALNKYICTITDNIGFFVTHSRLIDQNETSYIVQIEFTDYNTTYQTILSYTDFKNIEKKLCSCADLVNSILGENVATNDFYNLMEIGLKTRLDFYLVEDAQNELRHKLLRKLKNASKMTLNQQHQVSNFDHYVEEDVEEDVEQDIIEL